MVEMQPLRQTITCLYGAETALNRPYHRHYLLVNQAAWKCSCHVVEWMMTRRSQLHWRVSYRPILLPSLLHWTVLLLLVLWASQAVFFLSSSYKEFMCVCAYGFNRLGWENLLHQWENIHDQTPWVLRADYAIAS